MKDLTLNFDNQARLWLFVGVYHLEIFGKERRNRRSLRHSCMPIKRAYVILSRIPSI